MTTLGTPAHGAATGSGDRSRPRAVLPALCATQIVSWGIVYYAFPVLNPQITSETGWPAGATTAAFSLGLVVSALTGIRVGRILDRRGPRAIMTTGSVVGVVSLVIVATAPNIPVFIAGWTLAGLAMAATFYQPAFAALTRWWAPDHVRALTIVTLAGGLASTTFAPLTAALAGHLSWRYTYLVLAGILAAVTIPAHALALRAPWPNPPTASARTGTSKGAAGVVRSRPFLLLATAFTLSAFAMYAVVVALVPLLLERGYTTSQAAWALGIGGAGQTLGRTLYAALARRTAATARTTSAARRRSYGHAAVSWPASRSKSKATRWAGHSLREPGRPGTVPLQPALQALERQPPALPHHQLPVQRRPIRKLPAPGNDLRERRCHVRAAPGAQHHTIGVHGEQGPKLVPLRLAGPPVRQTRIRYRAGQHRLRQHPRHAPCLPPGAVHRSRWLLLP